MFNWLSRLFGNPNSNATKEVKKPAKKIETVTVTKVDASNIKVTKTGLNKLTKAGLEEFAKQNYGVDLDRRKSKKDLVQEILILKNKVI